MPEIPEGAVKAALAAYAHALYDRPTPTHLSDEALMRIVLEGAAPALAEAVAQAILAHMEAHGPQAGTPLGGQLRRAWRRHFSIAARVAAFAFTTEDDRKRLAAEHAAIGALLARGVSVACSDTNLPQRTARELAKIAARAKAGLDVRDLTDVPLDTCLARNAARTDKQPVPEARIREMHARYVAGRKHPLPWPDEPAAGISGLVPYVPKPGTPQAVLCDIDGTLAIHQGRSPYDYTRVSEDALNPSVAEFLHLAAWRVDGQRQVILMSGRPETARAGTEEWLARNQVPFDELHMRAAGDMRNDVIVKGELFDAHVRNRFSVIVALDDRNRVVALWRSLGLHCWQVNDGDF